MDDQQQLILWQWSTAVQVASVAMIATFFALLARFDQRTELRWWACAWAANLLALAVTLVFWYLRPPSLLPLLFGVYVGAKTAFVLFFVQGVWTLARPGAPLFGVRTLIAAIVAYGLMGGWLLSSIPQIGVVQHVTMFLVFVACAMATARVSGLRWLAAGLGVRAVLALAEAGAYALQLGGAWNGAWQSRAATFMSASSAFDMSAEWLLVLGSVLAVAARAQRDLRSANADLLAAQENLRLVAVRDPLTTLANRRALPDVFRAVQPVGAMLLFFDLDGFKALNDRHGHLAGDHCLRDFAGALRDSFRPNDYVIRYGGDEFLVVAQGMDRTSALARIDELSARLERDQREGPTCAFSVGMSELTAGGVPEAALRVADDEMYRVKAFKEAATG